jgi:adenine-specific DNA-methyltransferase
VAARDGSVIPLTHLFVVTDSLVEFQQVVSRLDQSLEITRLYADYLRSFEINSPR